MGINTDFTGKFQIHQFGQETAILNENGLILRKRPYLETRPFHRKPFFYKKAYLLFLIFLKVPMTSHSFHGLISLHRDVHTINSYMFIGVKNEFEPLTVRTIKVVMYCSYVQLYTFKQENLRRGVSYSLSMAFFKWL